MAERASGRTDKGDDLVNEGHCKTDDGKVKEVSPVGQLRVLAQLVLGGHDATREQPGQSNATKDDENVLRDEAPRRVGGPKERWLWTVSAAPASRSRH